MTEYTPLQIQLLGVRIARVSLANPFVPRNAPIDPATGKPKGNYHVDGIIEDTHPQLPAFKELMRAAIVRKFGDQADVVTQQIVANNKLCLHRGDIDRPGKPEYAGKLFISCNNPIQPTIVVTEPGNVQIATNGTPIVLTPAHPLWPYAGSMANLILQVFAYEHTGTKGVSANVMGVQFAGHGERLRGPSVASVGEFGFAPTGADSPPPGAAGGFAGSTPAAAPTASRGAGLL
jgi:hypothetical protein